MNIQNGLLLVGLVAVVMAGVYGLGWLYVRVIDPWIVRHLRATIALMLAALAVVLFLIGAGVIS